MATMTGSQSGLEPEIPGGFIIQARSVDRPLPMSIKTCRALGGRLLTAPGIRVLARPFITTPEAVEEAQPIVTDRYVIVYGGRLDSRSEIARWMGRDELARQPDGAVLAACWEYAGLSCADRLVGEFAFVIVDRRDGSIFASRDSLGIRPLFRCEMDGYLYLASDLQLLLSVLPETPGVCLDAVTELYVQAFVHPHTIYRGIEQLAPAHLHQWKAGRWHSHRSWQPSARLLELPRSADYDEALRSALFDGVRHAMRSSGPVLCQLSGGRDSSTVTSVASFLQQRNNYAQRGLHAYSLVASGYPVFDERKYQQAVVEKYGIDHHVIDVADHPDFARLATGVQPQHSFYAGASIAAIRTLARDVLGTETCLSGVGGDQVFLGEMAPLHLSGHLRRLAVRQWWRDIRGWARYGNMSLWQLVWYYSRGRLAWGSDLPDLPAWLTGRSSRMIRDAYLDAGRKRLGSPSARWHLPDPGTEEYIRSIVDVAPTAQMFDETVDVRHPLLYRPLVELMISIPWTEKFPPGGYRYLQARALAGILPEMIRCRASKAFRDSLLLGGLRDNRAGMRPFVAGERLAALGVVERDAFSAAANRFLHGVSHNDVHFLLVSLALEVWLRSDMGSEIAQLRSRIAWPTLFDEMER